MIDGKFCGSRIVQYAPFWNSRIYGQAPQNHNDHTSPEIIFLHTSPDETNFPEFDTLQEYNPRDTIVGKAIRERKGNYRCTGLIQVRKYGERHSVDISALKNANPPGIEVLYKGLLHEEENYDDWWF
jgi:hypothetical protein